MVTLPMLLPNISTHCSISKGSMISGCALVRPPTWTAWTSARRCLITVDREGRLDRSQTAKPVIDIPVQVQRQAVKRMQKLRKRNWKYPEVKTGDRTQPILVCRRSELDHFRNQSYRKLAKLQLASEHWHSRRTAGDYFTIKPYARAHFRQDFVRSFAELGLEPKLVEALKHAGFGQPSRTQVEAIPQVLQAGDCLVAAETGSGKTLAFVAPVLQRILSSEANPHRPATGAPLALILTPGRELAYQIFQVVQSLGSRLGLRSHLEVGLGHGVAPHPKTSIQGIPLDILVGTFGAVSNQYARNCYTRSSVRQIVLDEADTLLDDTFNPDTMPFLDQFRETRNQTVQRIFAAATYPTSLDTVLGHVVSSNDLNEVVSPGLHMPLTHVEQKFIRVSRDGRLEYLAELLVQDQTRGKSTLVFSNTSHQARSIARYLNDQGIQCAEIHSNLNHYQRTSSWSKFVSGEVKVISGTDVASRGLDSRDIGHVINFEFPQNMSDYVHRVGRVGRMASVQHPKITNFVRGFIQVNLVQKIETAIRRNTELPNVNNNIIRIIKQFQTKKDMPSRFQFEP
ncbi:probable ATP-dependent RNA helicase DDX28 [Tigriopus californicus]|uniref:probable ATP-dependent RNA helicase DDX28 n=1 Tax=Tigriopus californicus TaxID=6832 RepID=UPI0027DA9820|nr:probable ATP-dependent RNA helicase DDX28 [Tigriopus californicus]